MHQVPVVGEDIRSEEPYESPVDGMEHEFSESPDFTKGSHDSAMSLALPRYVVRRELSPEPVVLGVPEALDENVMEAAMDAAAPKPDWGPVWSTESNMDSNRGPRVSIPVKDMVGGREALAVVCASQRLLEIDRSFVRGWTVPRWMLPRCC